METKDKRPSIPEVIIIGPGQYKVDGKTLVAVDGRALESEWKRVAPGDAGGDQIRRLMTVAPGSFRKAQR